MTAGDNGDQGGSGNPYAALQAVANNIATLAASIIDTGVGTVTSTLNPGTASAATSQTAQTLDTYGNLLSQVLYDYAANSSTGYTGNPVQPNNSTPFRTYSFTYLTDSNYTSRYIRSRTPTTAQPWAHCSTPRNTTARTIPASSPRPSCTIRITA